MNFFKLETFDLPKTAADERFRKRISILLVVVALVVAAVLLIAILR